MADKPIQPGDFIWVGRFRNRPAIVTDIKTDEKGTLKYTYEPVPRGRKKPKTRNLLPYKVMSPEDRAKYKRIYDEETAKIRAKKRASQVMVMKVLARYHQAFGVMPPRELLSYVSKFETEFKGSTAKLYDSLRDLPAATKKYPDSEFLCRKLLRDLAIRVTVVREVSEELREVEAKIDWFQRAVKERQTSQVRPMDPFPQPIVEAIQRTLRPGTKFSDLLESVHPQRVKTLSADPDYEWSEKYEEGIAPEVWAALADVYGAASVVHDLLERTRKQLSAFVTGDLQPGKVETLYHASVKARQIAQKGFSAEMPKDQLGLGGSQSTKGAGSGISFTYDLKAALDIARSFKEAAMIAGGEIKASRILDWGVRETKIDEFITHLKVRLEKSGFKSRVTIDRDAGRWVVKEDDEEGKLIEKGIDQIFKSPEAIFEVYDAYLWAHPKRLNPVHLNKRALINYLKTADPKDIGVVAAKVDMTHPDIATLGGEREYRVPPAAVLEVTRFYQ